MSLKMFGSGPVSFRLFQCGIVEVEEFAGGVMPPVEGMGADPVSGWVESKRLFGREITAERCVFGSKVCMELGKAERKIPESLLAVTVQEELEAEMRARGVEYLPRAVRAEVAKRVSDTLLPDMPVVFSSIPFVLDGTRLFAAALNNSALDCFAARWRESTGAGPFPLGPVQLGVVRNDAVLNQLPPVCFSPDLSVVAADGDEAGMDFLTWLWFRWERDGGMVQAGDAAFAYMMEGPVTFFREGEGAHEVKLSKGVPLGCDESVAALAAGKKIKRVKFVMVADGETYGVTVDDGFAFRGLKLPKSDETREDFMSARWLFAERMRKLNRFVDAWLRLFDEFVVLRVSGAGWDAEVDAMRDWVRKMIAR